MRFSGISPNIFTMEAKEYLLERCLIRYVFEKYYQGKEPNYSEFAKLVFFDRADPVTTFRSVRQGKPKPQRISIEEAARMASIIGTDLASLCFNVQKEVENGWDLENDFKPDEALPGPKKRRKNSKAAMENNKFRKIGGCIILQKIGQLPEYEMLLCPACKKPMTANNDVYVCSACEYSTNKRQTDEALARDKARYGVH